MSVLMSVKDAAEYIGIEPGTLQKWCQKKQIPHYKVTNRPMFKKAEIERFIEMRRVPAIARIREPRVRAGKAARRANAERAGVQGAGASDVPGRGGPGSGEGQGPAALHAAAPEGSGKF